jgi:hypothetical protein
MSIIGVALARNAETARKVILRFQCESSALVGDFVYQDPSTDEKVLVSTTNLSVYKTIGLIDSKPDTNIAEVLILGVKGGYSGLTRGSTVFLSDTGTPTTTRPTNNGYLQALGVAVSEDSILVIPNNIRTKLV